MMRLITIIVFLSVITCEAQVFSGDELNRLYTEYVQLKSIEQLSETDAHYSFRADSGDAKCGLRIVNLVRENFHQFTPEQRNTLRTLFQRPVRQTSMVTPSGKFRIHYNETGTGVPKYDLGELARAIDSSYNYQVNFLGYPPPPSDFGAGGDDLYDIYIQNLGSGSSGLYGYTEFETEIIAGTNRFSSFIVIDDDYLDYFTPGINGARVTVAHELHHAIQGGNYIFRSSDIYFYEITSTAMEKFVFETLNDYRQYLPSYFQNPGRSFSLHSGYNLALWNFFLRDQFGIEIIKKQWELMPQMRALNSIALSISEKGSQFGDELNTFGLWTYFTGYRTVPGRFFKDALSYPTLQYTATMELNLSPLVINLNAKAASNNFIRVINPFSGTGSPDTLVALISNSNVQGGIDSIFTNFPFTYSLAVDSISGYTRLTGNYFFSFSAVQPANWSTAEILNNEIIREGKIKNESLDFAFPSPFRYSKHSFIYFPVESDASGMADVSIFSSGMSLVFSSAGNVISRAGQKVISWNALDYRGKKVNSGVYLFITKSGNNEKKGKVVIFND